MLYNSGNSKLRLGWVPTPEGTDEERGGRDEERGRRDNQVGRDMGKPMTDSC